MTYPLQARAFVPGHITGLFRIHDDSDDPLQCGSTGAGFCITAGTVTTVKMEQNEQIEIIVKYNNRPIEGPVTKAVIQDLTRDYGISCRVNVQHESSLPIGVGWGASGAGALGTALATSSLISEDISLQESARYAHVAEVSNHTGLGDVIAQATGGFEIRKKPGPPGIGEIVKLGFDRPYNVLLAGGSGLDTSNVLTNKYYRERINRVGEGLLSELLQDPSIEQFVRCSRSFTSETRLESSRVSSALSDLESKDILSSMVMLGDSVFCFCDVANIDEATRILTSYWSDNEILNTSIAEEGGRVI